MSLLTLKHIDIDGYEHIQMAHSVAYLPDKEELDAFGCTQIGGAVDQHGYCRYGTGTVYVMNDSGSTVGRYYLKSK